MQDDIRKRRHEADASTSSKTRKESSHEQWVL